LVDHQREGRLAAGSGHRRQGLRQEDAGRVDRGQRRRRKTFPVAPCVWPKKCGVITAAREASERALPQRATPAPVTYEADLVEQPEPAGPLVPPRGGLVSPLGLLSFLFPFPLGPIAWVLGNIDLAEIEAGRMDPAGVTATRSGRLCGKISSIVLLVLFSLGVILNIITLSSGALKLSDLSETRAFQGKKLPQK